MNDATEAKLIALQAQLEQLRWEASQLRLQVDQLRQVNDQLRGQWEQRDQELARAGRANQYLRDEVAQLWDQNQQLQEQNQQLRDQLDQAQKAQARQAAPFRRSDRKRVPETERRRPGRPAGHEGARRPVPETVDQQITVPLDGCPQCGGPVTNVEACRQHIEELPPVRPTVIALVTYRGQCAWCGPVQSRHPWQTSTARGAAGVQLGPRALAWSVALNKQFGLTSRKTSRVLANLVGLSLSPSGVVQAAGRAARRLQAGVDQAQADLRAAAGVHIDETSWYVGAPNYWLWVFTTPTTTLYHVDWNRNRQVVLDQLGPDFDGIVTTDCLNIYDDLPYRTHKCIAHHEKALAQARDRPDNPDPSSLKALKSVLTEIRLLWDGRSWMGERVFGMRRRALESRLDRLLAGPCAQPGDESVRQRLAKQRAVLLGCLDDPAAEPTNNRAERALRDVGVIARKLSCGNKTDRGRQAWQVLTSLAVTCQQRGQEFVDWLTTNLPLTATVSLPSIPATDAR